MIEIWTPRYHDKVVLIAKYKVCSGSNTIKFTKAKHLLGHLFQISGDEIRKCKLETNGSIPCYAVPMDRLEDVSEKNNPSNIDAGSRAHHRADVDG